MKSNNSILICIIALILGVTIGYFLGASGGEEGAFSGGDPIEDDLAQCMVKSYAQNPSYHLAGRYDDTPVEVPYVNGRPLPPRPAKLESWFIERNALMALTRDHTYNNDNDDEVKERISGFRIYPAMHKTCVNVQEMNPPTGNPSIDTVHYNYHTLVFVPTVERQNLHLPLNGRAYEFVDPCPNDCLDEQYCVEPASSSNQLWNWLCHDYVTGLECSQKIPNPDKCD
ncbi:hypothetical protein [Sanyastnella coralliicola]|uniref:hypothetical protein n=1 Tax=Sanyastnella coralliicola TaxID=3069118 RepID=UPI0027B97F2A|nr:hypothetical protein [Longitalea sp. SCSIO 12813]